MSAFQKTLGPTSGAGLVLNIVIGAGLLSLPGLAYEASGADAIWVWGLCAIVSIPLLAVFVIMGSRHPDAGGVAHFGQMAFGRFAYIAASLIFLGAVIFGLPAIALVGGYYFSDLTGFNPTLSGLAILLLAASTQLAAPGKASGISGYIASIVLLVLLFIIAVGLTGISPEWITERPLRIPKVPMSDLLMPFMMVFFAFTGWEVAAGTAEEFKNPRRDFPIAMFLSFAIAVVLYIGMALILHFTPVTGPYEAAFAEIMRLQLGEIGGVFMSLVAVSIITANLMGAIWAVSRMVFSLSREGVIPIRLATDMAGRPLGAVCYVVVALVGVLVLDLVGVLSISTMLELAGQNFILLYAIAGASLLKLSPRPVEKLAGLVALLIVGALLTFQGLLLSYPAALLVLSIIIYGLRKNRTSRARRPRNPAP